MPRPKAGYPKGYPGCTTVAGVMKDAAPLMWWAWNEGKEGRDYRETADKAASAGTMVHDAAEAWKRGRPYLFEGDPAIVDKAQNGFSAFIEWTSQTRLKIEATEISLVCECYKYGATLDATVVNDKRAICEYKTSASVYPEHLLQMAAQRHVWECNFPDKPIQGGHHLLRFSRDHGDFAANWYGELDDAWQAFLHCRALYDLKAALKQRCR